MTTDPIRQAQLRDEANRNEHAIRRQERDLEAGERDLERRLAAFDESETKAKLSIESEWRSEHSGHDPERPPSWRATAGATEPPTEPAPPEHPAPSETR